MLPEPRNNRSSQLARTRVSILGSTGSIGRSALDVIRLYPDRFEVVGLAAHSNIELLKSQIAEFRPEKVAVADVAAGEALRSVSTGVEVLSGQDAIERLAKVEVDVALCAVVGAAGLDPLLAAIESGNRIALANKEPLVMAGPIVMERARRKGVEVIPVDSEHNAIFQCLHGHSIEDVHSIHLTASGGPFYGRAREELADVSPEEAASHPTWDMGAKISVDSATLMNKGLEVIEAMCLFDLPLEKVKVIIHRQSIAHSFVEFNDGSILGHFGVTDMKFPILFALTWPQRVETPMARLDLTKIGELSFEAPDFSRFPCLRHALDAAGRGGTAPAILNAANEVAVAAFCEGRISFLQISDVVGKVIELCACVKEIKLDVVLAADKDARRHAEEVVTKIGR